MCILHIYLHIFIHVALRLPPPWTMEERHGLAWSMEGRDGLGMGLRHGLEDGLGLRHGLEAWGREGWLGLRHGGEGWLGLSNGKKEILGKTWKQISKKSKNLSFPRSARKWEIFCFFWDLFSSFINYLSFSHCLAPAIPLPHASSPAILLFPMPQVHASSPCLKPMPLFHSSRRWQT